MKRKILQWLLAGISVPLALNPSQAAPVGTVVSWGKDVIPYVAPGTRFTKIAAGGDHSLALTSGGTVVAWGDVSQSPVPAGLSNVIAIAAGGWYSLALVASPSVSLQIQLAGNNLILSWPSSSQNFVLQTTTHLADPNSWVTLTNAPAVVNLRNAVTTSISGAQAFFRLMQTQ